MILKLAWLGGRKHLGSAFGAQRGRATADLAVCHRPLYERQGYACVPTPLLHCCNCDMLHMRTPACRPAAPCDIKTGTLDKRDFISRHRCAE